LPPKSRRSEKTWGKSRRVGKRKEVPKGAKKPTRKFDTNAGGKKGKRKREKPEALS